ncbi:protein transport protein Sec61 subunit gamma [Seiridium cupressi]
MADQVSEILDLPKDLTPKEAGIFGSSASNTKEKANASSSAKEGSLFLQRCTKPDRQEFVKICQAVGVGFLIMGAVGYIVKLIHIPVNNILVGGA